MKYIKKFNDKAQLETYKKSNFVSPHVYLDSNLNTVKFMQEYKQLEYISSTKTGGQYIDLGCKLMENTDDILMYIKFNIKGNGKDNNGQSTLIVSQPEVTPYPGFVLRKTGNDVSYNNYQFIDCSAKWSFENSTKTNGSNKYYANALRGPLNYESLDTTNTIHKRIGNIYEETVLFNNIPQNQCHNMNCHLFCAVASSNQPFRYVEADLYYLRFIKGGQVVRNLIPVKKVATNEIGLYDMENDHLYVSQGDDPFVAGPIINN